MRVLPVRAVTLSRMGGIAAAACRFPCLPRSVRPRASLLVTTAVLALSAGLTACDDPEEETPYVAVTSTSAVSPSSVALTPGTAITPGPGVTLYRWANLSILVPDGSGIAGSPGVVEYPGKPLHFLVGLVDPEDSRITSTVVLDSENGAIVEEEVLDEHREEIDRVLRTLEVGPLDRSLAPWPYTGELTADLFTENGGGASWIQPPPSSGLYAGWGIGDPGGFFVHLRNERSTAFAIFDEAKGALTFDTSAVAPEDLPAFERWLATVKYCDTDIKC